nr:DUF4239 domain-containing protein [Pelomonas sp. P8]
MIVYTLPNWVLGLALVALWLVAAQALCALFPDRWRERVTDLDRSVVLASLGVIATMNSLLLAFSAVSAWEAFGSADTAVQREGTAITQLARSLSLYDTAPSRLARERLRAYGRSVVTQEWPAMLQDKPSLSTRDALDGLFTALGDLKPTTSSQTALLNQAWTQANDLLTHRRERLQASKAKVPRTLWIVVLAGSLLTLVPLAAAPKGASSRCALFAVAAALALVFHFVATMDRPFLGSERVTPEAIEDALGIVQRLSARTP